MSSLQTTDRDAISATKELLRFLTCGSVDDGKSTLLGRLLLDSGAVFDDQLAALENDSARYGTLDDQLDPALLMDGLEDERQQGITIDVAYRYFSTENRKYIIADAPGHEQFTRNMATGASTADLAIILVDAVKGISEQTRRHAFIVASLGIKKAILAVNKMDLVDFDRTRFDGICRDFDSFAADLAIDEVVPIPLSATSGDNVVHHSERTPWYTGPTLLQQLESVAIEPAGAPEALRFPVQWVNRPDESFRGFSGTLASGTLQVGQQVRILPSQKLTRVSRLVSMNGDQTSAESGDAITVTLDDELDVTRGDMIVDPVALPHISRSAKGCLIWMSDESLVPGRPYWCKHTTSKTSCEVVSVSHRFDMRSLERVPARSLQQNEIGLCELSFRDPIFYDSYSENRGTGSFILVDRIKHETVAAGMLIDPRQRDASEGNWNAVSPTMEAPETISLISDQIRADRYGHQPFTILVTGLSGSGKSSVAIELEKRLFDQGRIVFRLDGRSMRLGLSRDLGFTAEQRSENLRRAAEVARLVNDAGQICVAAFVAPSEWVRRKARDVIGADRFFHVHLSTPVDVCRQRDITGQYTAADKGEIEDFPGVTFEFEPPEHADLIIDSSHQTIAQIADAIADRLMHAKLLTS